MSDPIALPLPGLSASPSAQLLTQPESWAYIGVPRTTWFRLRAMGKLPEPVAVPGGDRLYWRRSDLDQWIAKLKPARGPRSAPKKG